MQRQVVTKVIKFCINPALVVKKTESQIIPKKIILNHIFQSHVKPINKAIILNQ